MTNDIKIGRPQQIGPLEVWPLMWEGVSDSRYKTPPMGNELKFEEYDDGDGPRVSCIQVENLSDQDFLIPSGWIVGAELLQVRTFNSAELVPAGHAILADVSCVERGRWSSGKNRVDAGRAPISVVASGWDFEHSSQSWKLNRETRQSRVWSQVSRQESRSGVRKTNSLEQIMREDASSDLNLSSIQSEVTSRLSTYVGQNGALIAYEGEPLLMEFFSNESAAKGILRETLSSLAFDLDQFQFRPTAKSHVEAFIRKSGIEEMYMLSEDDWAALMAGGNEHIDTKAMLDSQRKVMHLTAIHRSHRLLMEV
jgi:hypothetical protein